jgi:hypothetical protein
VKLPDTINGILNCKKKFNLKGKEITQFEQQEKNRLRKINRIRDDRIETRYLTFLSLSSQKKRKIKQS